MKEGKRMKDEIEKYFDIDPLLSLEKFVELLFVSLANKTMLLGRRKPISFPFDYLRIIENIMYNNDSSWKIKFSKLIDIRNYYGKQADWERDFGREINKYLANRKVTYDFQWNYFSLEITPEESESVLKKYDEETIENMEHFTNLLTNSCYERRFLLKRKENEYWINEKIREQQELEHIISLERKLKIKQEKNTTNS